MWGLGLDGVLDQIQLHPLDFLFRRANARIIAYNQL